MFYEILIAALRQPASLGAQLIAWIVLNYLIKTVCYVNYRKAGLGGTPEIAIPQAVFSPSTDL